MRRVVAIVQARMGSSRLPGKVLADLGGDTMLARVVGRLRACVHVDDIMIATTLLAADDAIAREATRLDAGVFRGSADDVLSRYVGAAAEAGADAIVRVTSDRPLLDAEVVDCVVLALDDEVDYASNTHERTFPRGLDCEALHADTLARIGRMATSAAAREHVTAYVMEQPARFAVRQVRAARDDADLRWTVDTEEDLALVRTLYARFGLARAALPYAELARRARAMPELAAINAHVAQKSWRHVG